jgi:hypothetical protein
VICIFCFSSTLGSISLTSISTFIIGLIINQNLVVTTNTVVLFPMIGIVSCLVVSFVLGVKAMICDSIKDKMLAICLLLSFQYGM